MKARWIAAAVGAVALAIFTLPKIYVSSTKESPSEETSTFATPDGAACDAKAKPANYSFTLKDMNGNDVKLVDHKGKVILLDFWATW